MSVTGALRAANRSDLVLAVVATTACEAELLVQGHASSARAAAAVLLAFGGATVIWRRREPLVASCLTVLFTLAAVSLVSATDLVTPQYIVFLPPYTIGAWTTRGRSLVGLAACLAAFCVFSAATATSPASWAFGVGMVVGSFFVGRVVRAQRLLVAELEGVAASIAASREESSRLVAQDVRSRISDDVSSLVAHSIASMVVTSEAALRLLPVNGGEADAAMLALEEMGREALSEMRRVLGVLRREADDNDRPERCEAQVA